MAGAREMMRYRRNRTEGNPPSATAGQSGAVPISSSTGNIQAYPPTNSSAGNWAVYQPGAIPAKTATGAGTPGTNSQVPTTQHLSMRKVHIFFLNL